MDSHLKTPQCDLEFQSGARDVWSVALSMEKEDRRELAERLAGLAGGQFKELKHELPKGWTFYWKIRDEHDDRFIVAHSEQGQWVGTLALTLSSLNQFVELLKEKEEITLQNLGTAHFLTNIDLRISAL